MKNFRYKILIVFLTLGLLWIPYEGFSQEFSRDMKLTRKEKQEAKKAGLYENFKAIETLLDKKTFVLEAEYLQNRYGGFIPVSSNINFIQVDPSAVVLQTGSSAASGYNGVGGVTAEGSLNTWKVTKDQKRMNYTVYFTTTTNIGTYDVLLRIGADASATATITGMTRGSLIYRGNLVAPYNSRVFKGQKTL
jgi:hypothetical protein